MKVAVVGAGAAGSACAWRLLTSKSVRDLSVTVFEMGRGAGGRAGTRRVPAFPGLSINPGAPLFHVPASDMSNQPLISALLSAGHLAEWRGTFGGVDARTGVTCAGEASRGELMLGSQQVMRYTGTPGMSSVAKGMLDLAGKDGTLHTHFSTRIKQFRPVKDGDSIVGWEILDKNGTSFSVFDWIVMSGATPALDRWRAGFKEEPPVYAAAQASGSKLFQGLIAHLDKPLPYEQTHVVMAAWEVAGEGGAESIVQCLEQLPFAVTKVTDDTDLAKVTIQSLGPPYAIVALHSTHAFAQKHKNVMGAGSFVSVSNNVEGSSQAEGFVGGELLGAFGILLEKFGSLKLPPLAWGPSVHRWGAAFPEPDLGPVGSGEAWMLPAERFAFAGDFVAPPYACVATALRSGLAAGDALLKHAAGHPVAEPMIKSTI